MKRRHAPLEVTFHTDGSGLVWDPHEPHHLDAILAYQWRVVRGLSMDCDPERPPEEADLPLAKWQIGDWWGWRASALFPVGDPAESVQWARRRFDDKRIHLQSAAVVNTAAGSTKNTNKPWPLVLARAWRAWCCGDVEAVRALLAGVRALGRERGRGRGSVVAVQVECAVEDWSVTRDGLAMRYLPHPESPRIARCRPPYWHMHGRCAVTSVGDPFQ